MPESQHHSSCEADTIKHLHGEQAAAGMQQSVPQLWLRIAECCISLADEQQNRSTRDHKDRQEHSLSTPEAMPIGSGQEQQLLALRSVQTALLLIRKEQTAFVTGAPASAGLSGGPLGMDANVYCTFALLPLQKGC